MEIEAVDLTASSGSPWNAKSEGAAPKQIEPGKASDVRFSATVPQDEAYTRPYFTRTGLDEAYYRITDTKDLNLPFAPYPLAATVRFRFEGLTLEAANVVQVISKVNGPGTLRYPMPVGPPVSLALSPSAGIVPLGEKSFGVSVRLHNNVEGQAKAMVHL